MATNRVINTILNLRDNLSGGLLQAARNTSSVSREMQSATRNVLAFRNRAVSAIENVVKKTSALAVTAAGAVATLAAKTGFSEALDLEGYRTQLETATKDTQRASEVMQYSINLANRTPFEGGELVAASAAMEMFGLKSERWLTVLGDAAAATNQKMADVQRGFIDALTTGDFTSLRDTLSVTKEAVDSFSVENFGKSFLNSKGQVTNMSLLQDALEGLLKERYAGGMEKLSQTVRGSWSTITGVTKSSLATLAGMNTDGTIRAGSALEIIKEKTQTLANQLVQWQQDGTIDALAEKFNQGLAVGMETAAQAAQQASEIFSTALQWAREHSDGLITALELLGGTIATLKIMKLGLDVFHTVHDFALFVKTIGAVNVRLVTNGIHWMQNTVEIGLNKGALIAHTVVTKASAIATGTLTGAQRLLNLVFVQTPIGKVILLMTGLIAVGVLLYKNWDTIKATALNLWDSFKTAFGGIKDCVVGAFEKAKDGVLGFFDWIGDKLGELNQKIESIPVIGDAYKGIKRAGGWISEHLLNRPQSSSAITTRKETRDRLVNHATGTSYFAGGATRINERGGEIVDLPSGTKIIPHDISENLVRTSERSKTANRKEKQRVVGAFQQIAMDTAASSRTRKKGNTRLRLTNHATGTSYFPGGLTRIHERGGEIVNLPSGAQIIPHDISQRMTGTPTVQVYVTVQGNIIGNRSYAQELGDIVLERLLKAMRNS